MLSILCSLALGAPAPAAILDESEEAYRRRVTPIVQVARDASPAVVYIRNEGRQIVGQNWFGQIIERDFSGTGSGVVIHKDGFIITNYHVVDGAQKLVVSFDKQYDATDYRADLVSFVKEEDLALLKIRGERDFPTIPLGHSSDLMLGETVIAIGNPYGQTHTVSQGIVSGLHRNVQIPAQFAQLKFDDLIQTDASINPGNSGGPLLNINGELIGINNAVNPNAQNIGFAIPVDHVKRVLQDRLLAPDSAPTWLGFEVEGSDHVQVGRIVPGSPAELAGLKSGDCVVAVGGTPVVTHDEYRLARVGLAPKREVELKIERAGKVKSVRLAPWDKADGILYEHVGIKAETIESPYESYVRITEVRPGGPAAELGLTPGDILDAVSTGSRAALRKFRFVTRELFANFIADVDAGTRLEIDVLRDVDRDGRYDRRNELHRGTLTVR